MTTTTITTKSGSVYKITEQDGVKTISAQNVPNYRMRQMVGEHRCITESWPPAPGDRVSFLAPSFEPEWITTSRVEKVEQTDAD